MDHLRICIHSHIGFIFSGHGPKAPCQAAYKLMPIDFDALFAMAPNTMSVPLSALMHACLAYHSPEFQAFSHIIYLHSKNALLFSSPFSSCPLPKTNLGSLPPEVLVAIRAHLLPLLTLHLTALSVTALASYESSLVSLLCPDCQAYSIYVYGSKVWNWPYFPGPCSCPKTLSQESSRRTALLVQCLKNRTTSVLGTISKAPHVISSQIAPDIQVFSNPHHWLYMHLSKRANRIYDASRRSLEHIASQEEEIGIWGLVSDVLREFDCEVAPRGITSAAWLGSRSQEVSIIPTSLLGAEEDGTADRECRDAVIIRRVEKELGLDYEFDEFGGRNTGGHRRYRVRARGAFSIHSFCSGSLTWAINRISILSGWRYDAH